MRLDPAVKLAFPPDWKVHQNNFPLGALTPEDVLFLTEDVIWVVTPRGITIDVGWYRPTHPAGGSWVCRLVVGDDWEHPLKVFETQSHSRALGWLLENGARLVVEARGR